MGMVLPIGSRDAGEERVTGCGGIVDRTTSILFTTIQFNYLLNAPGGDWRAKDLCREDSAIRRNTKLLWAALDSPELRKCICIHSC